MIKPKIILPVLAVIFAISYGCQKEEIVPPADQKSLSFISLTAADNTIEAGSNTAIKAVAFGYNLTYYWSPSVGAILKSGSEVLYTCCPDFYGEVIITCTVKDGYGNSKSKTVTITVI
ncbi:hypothetical protein ES705_20182 [subsurface metagenome]